MFTSRVVEVEGGDVIAAVQRFLARLLDEKIADCLFVQVVVPGQEPHMQVVTDRQGLSVVNPLLPVMPENAVESLRQAMNQRPQAMFLTVLRPCEVRVVMGLARRGQIDLSRLILIGIDCPAAYEPDVYHQALAEHPDDPGWLMYETLRAAHKGQMTPYRYRDACQFCDRAIADHRVVNIILGAVGIEFGRKILILADGRSDARLKLHKATDRQATEREIVERETTLWRLSKCRKEAIEHKLEKLGLIEASPQAVIGYMSKCTLCGRCVETCLLPTDELSRSLNQGRDAFISAFIKEQHLSGCSGCGVCQLHCPEGIPLHAISYVARQRV